MRPIKKIAIALLAATSLPAATAVAATLGGIDYATQYDYREFYTAVDHKTFRADLRGNPFPGLTPEDTAQRLLPVMQANKPIPPLTFTYAVPAEKPHPDYRVVVIFDPANDLGADGVCATGQVRHKPQTPGKVYLFGIYCRNDQALSQTTGWVVAATPEDPAVGNLFKDLFATLFDPSPAFLPQHGKVDFR
jgi:hypothetical protein